MGRYFRLPSLLLLAGVCVCSPGRLVPGPIPDGSGENGGVTWSAHGGVITAANSLIEVRWDSTSGALVGLKNKTSGTELLGGSLHSAWSTNGDPLTTDIWSARPPPAHPGSATVLGGFAANALDGGGFVFDFSFAPQGSTVVVQHVRIVPGDAFAHWTTELAVAPFGGTVVSIASPELLGVVPLAGEELAWPWHEGMIFPHPGNDLQWMQYPAAASMQWMELYTPTEGLYYGVVDATGSYKEFTFGYDPALGRDDQPRVMSASFFGYVTPGGAFTTPEVEVGVAPEGKWYWGADHYRAFLASSGMSKNLPKLARELFGWRRGFDMPLHTACKNPGPQLFDYCAIPKLFMPDDFTDRTGYSMLALYGWMYDGMDTFYPDYDYLAKNAANPTCLQQSDLAASVQTLAARPKPNSVMMYMNAHVADPLGDWYQDPSHAAGRAMAADGGPYVEGYASQPGRIYHVMCPAAQVWQDRLHDKAMELRGMGVRGLYLDQLEEVPAEPCYDRTHGHSTPLSAFPEGYRAFLTRLTADFSLGGADPEYVLSAEGVNDFYSQWIDVPGSMPERPIDDTRTTCGQAVPFGTVWPCGAVHAPEISRYTMSARFLGIANGPSFGKPDEFAHAFLFGDAFRGMQVGYECTDASNSYRAIDPHEFPRYSNLYASAPDVYYYGTYLDARGLTLDADPADVLGTIILGSHQDRAGLQLWNRTSTSRTVLAEIDLDALGLASSAAVDVSDLDGNAAPAFQSYGRKVAIILNLPAHDVKALLVSGQ